MLRLCNAVLLNFVQIAVAGSSSNLRVSLSVRIESLTAENDNKSSKVKPKFHCDL